MTLTCKLGIPKNWTIKIFIIMKIPSSFEALKINNKTFHLKKKKKKFQMYGGQSNPDRLSTDHSTKSKSFISEKNKICSIHLQLNINVLFYVNISLISCQYGWKCKDHWQEQCRIIWSTNITKTNTMVILLIDINIYIQWTLICWLII